MPNAVRNAVSHDAPFSRMTDLVRPDEVPRSGLAPGIGLECAPCGAQ